MWFIWIKVCYNSKDVSYTYFKRWKRIFYFWQKEGKGPLFSKGVLWEVNIYWRDCFCCFFSTEKFEIILLLTNNGGIIGVFLLFTKWSIIFQYVVGSVKGSPSFWLNCLIYFSFVSKIFVGHSFDAAVFWTKSNFLLPLLKYFLVNFACSFSLFVMVEVIQGGCL